MSNLLAFYRTHFHRVLALVILVLVSLAWVNRFMMDDAFISFRYARHLAEGRGLVWNDGEPVEGYTNFLWTLIMTIPFLLDVDPILFSQILGLGCFVLTLWFTYRLSRLLLNSQQAALLTVILLGTNYTFSAYATGGLETQLQASLFVILWYLPLRNWRLRTWRFPDLLLISLLATGALMIRPDSVLLICPVLLFSLLGLECSRSK